MGYKDLTVAGVAGKIISSSSIHVYPCAWRDTAYANESLLNTEYNLTHIQMTGIKDSYEVQGNSRMFCIHGYFFTIEEDVPSTCRYLTIRLSGNTKDAVLANVSSGASGTLDSNNYFYGLFFSPTEPTVTNGYTLDLEDASPTAADTDSIVNAGTTTPISTELDTGAVTATGTVGAKKVTVGVDGLQIGSNTYKVTTSAATGTVPNALLVTDANGNITISSGSFTVKTAQYVTEKLGGENGVNISDILVSNSGVLTAKVKTADKLDSSAGTATKPVYFSGGKPVACTHQLNKTVPSDAVFTDNKTCTTNYTNWMNLVGAPTQGASIQTYSTANTQVNSSGLWSKTVKVGSARDSAKEIRPLYKHYVQIGVKNTTTNKYTMQITTEIISHVATAATNRTTLEALLTDGATTDDRVETDKLYGALAGGRFYGTYPATATYQVESLYYIYVSEALNPSNDSPKIYVSFTGEVSSVLIACSEEVPFDVTGFTVTVFDSVIDFSL